MKIYFAGSIRGGRDDQALYMEIIRELQSYGTVLTEHVGSKELAAQGETFSEAYIYERDMSWLTSADVVVAEVTQPSLGVGYELGKTEDMNKPLLCLFRPSNDRRLSAMLRGNPRVHVEEYKTIQDVKLILKDFFNPARTHDTADEISQV